MDVSDSFDGHMANSVKSCMLQQHVQHLPMYVLVWHLLKAKP